MDLDRFYVDYENTKQANIGLMKCLKCLRTIR